MTVTPAEQDQDMCFMCEGGTPAQYLGRVADDIETVGWHVVTVEPSGRSPGWAYTVGLLERFEHPELVVTGILHPWSGGSALNAVGQLVADGGRLAPGDTVTVVPEGRALRIGAVHPRHFQTDRFTYWWERNHLLDEPLAPAALQVITADGHGRWQDDVGNRRWRQERLDAAPHVGRR